MADRLLPFKVTVSPAGSRVRRSKTVLARSRDTALQMVTAHKGDRVTTSAPGVVAEFVLRLQHMFPPSARSIRAFYMDMRTALRADSNLANALRNVLPSVTDSHIAVAVSNAIREADAAHGTDAILDALKGFLPLEHVERLRASVEAAETEKVVDLLGKSSDKQVKLASKLTQAAIMPMVTIAAAIGAGIFMASTQLPVMAKIFENSKAPLPLPTTILLHVVEVIKGFPLLGVALVLAPVFIILALPRIYASSALLQDLADKLPVLGPVIVKIRWAKALRTASLLLESRLSIVKTLEFTARATQHIRTRRFLLNVASHIETRASDVFEAARIYQHELNGVDTRWIDLLPLGAATGDQATVLANVAMDYEERAEAVTETLPKILEFASIAVATAIVGGVMAATVLPSFSLASVLK